MGQTRKTSTSMMCGGREFLWGRRTYIMGIINLTPDSFSGDGVGTDVRKALDKARAFVSEGADIIDIGAESTRPGYSHVSIDEELSRLVPSLQEIASKVEIPISVDTYKKEVAEQALAAGASMINDVWGVDIQCDMASVAARYNIPIVLMHNQDNTEYVDLVPDIMDSLKKAVDRSLDAGINSRNIILDPGIGFGKTADQNIEILRRLAEFQSLGYPILTGTSRKSTIGLVLGLPVNERTGGTAATVALAVGGGADIVRVHDVSEMSRVVKMSDAIIRNWRPPYWCMGT